MQGKHQSGMTRWRRRIVPIILGFTASFGILFIGSTSGTEPRLWLIPSTIIILLVAFSWAKRIVPGIATWCEAAITFLLAAVASSLLIGGAVASLVWASFDTEYATGYTKEAFKAIKLGDTRKTVALRIGDPLSSYDSEPFQQWIFSADQQRSFAEHGRGDGTYTIFTLDRTGRVKSISGQTMPSANTIRIGNGENFLKLKKEDILGRIGSTTDDIKKEFGTPVAVYDYKASKVLQYSRSPSGSNYHLRKLGLDEEDKVIHIWSSVYWD